VFTVQLGDLDLTATDADGVKWAVENVDGWGSTGSTASQTQRPRQSGAWSGSKYAKARDVSIEGTFRAPSPDVAQAAADRLHAAASRTETPLRIAEAGSPRWAPVFQTGETVVDWLSPLEATWSVQLASDDWRKFGEQLSVSTALPSTTGGLVVVGEAEGAGTGTAYSPEQAATMASKQGYALYPRADGTAYDFAAADGTPTPATALSVIGVSDAALRVPFTIDAVTVTGQVSLSNAGNESGPVRLRIDGPCTGPVITHGSTGAQLVFSTSLVLRAGEWLEVDMENRTVLANGQAGRAGWITSRGWSAFDPGDNSWAFTAAVYHPASRLTVTATPSWK